MKILKIIQNVTAQRAIVTVFMLGILFGVIITAEGADIRPHIHGSGSYRELVIEGIIKPGDFEKFIKTIKNNDGKISTVYLFTPGGDFDEAMKIGRAMRTLELASMSGPSLDSRGRLSCDGEFGTPVPTDPKNCTCASAGFFIHIGGVHRGGTFLAVHRPYFEKGKFGNLSEKDAKREFDALQNRAREYMQEMGVPKHVQEDVLGTPSDRALLLDEKTVKTYFWGKLPYRHEWLKNKCSLLSDDEKDRAERYSQKLLSARGSSEADLSKEEWADLKILRKKQDDERDCEIAITDRGRLDAYEKYFGVKPNDYQNHNFSKWSEALKYLGKNFDEILVEEKFEEKKFAGFPYLERSATASAPSISLSALSDSSAKERVVTSISLVSTPNPSQEFIALLIKSMDNSWGKHFKENGSNQWKWESDKFTAALTHQPVAADGPYLGLTINEK